MFKQVLSMIFSSIISYLLTFYIMKMNYRRFYFINGVIKYPLNCTIKNAVYEKISELSLIDNFIFYSKEPINCENYIYDKTNNFYYLIEPGYYYYINENPNLIKHFNSNLNVFYSKIK